MKNHGSLKDPDQIVLKVSDTAGHKKKSQFSPSKNKLCIEPKHHIKSLPMKIITPPYQICLKREKNKS